MKPLLENIITSGEPISCSPAEPAQAGR